MKKFALLVLPLILAGCAAQNSTAPDSSSQAPLAAPASLLEAKRQLQTRILPQKTVKTPAETAPPAIFRTLSYSSPVGQLAAYLSPDPKNGKKIRLLFGLPAAIAIRLAMCGRARRATTTKVLAPIAKPEL